VWFEGVAEVAKRDDISVILLFMGAARLKEHGPAALTMTAADGVETARAFPSAKIVPVQWHRWAHYGESREDIATAFEKAGLSDRLCWLEPGENIVLSAFGAEARWTRP